MEEMMLERITESTTIAELCAAPEFSQVKDLIFTNMDAEKLHSRLSDYGERKGQLVHALRYTASLAAAGQITVPVYPENEIRENAALQGVCLIRYNVHPGKPYVMICPGGGYNREWTLVEGFPLADRLNQLGYNAFILIYRTGKAGLFPEPLADLAAAVRYVDRHRTELRTDPAGYALTGASAGGHLIAEWGTKQEGYAHYGLPKPGALLMTYPAAIADLFYNGYAEALQTGDQKTAAEAAKFLARIGGEQFTANDIRRYSLECQIDADYPPVYNIHCRDDRTVPVESSIALEKLLTEHQIPHETHLPEKGGHSFGLGVGTDAEGWMEQAVRFWRRQEVL